ncbi:hypothetical protein TNCV_36051, partial [Trichonephila clavipes]
KLKNQSWLKYILVITEAIAEKEGLEKLSETQILPFNFVSTSV